LVEVKLEFVDYRYLLGVAILSILYSGFQAFRQSQEPCTGENIIQPRTARLIDFVGDQVWHSFFSNHIHFIGVLFLYQTSVLKSN